MSNAKVSITLKPYSSQKDLRPKTAARKLIPLTSDLNLKENFRNSFNYDSLDSRNEYALNGTQSL